MWANNLLTYYKTLDNPNVYITPVSFDRKSYINEDTGILKRVFLGIKELSVSVKNVETLMRQEPFDVIHICTSASLSLFKDLKLLQLARKYNVKSVVHLHFGRTPDLAVKKNLEWMLLKKVVSKADSVVTMDSFTHKTLIISGCKNVRYCPNPLSLSIINQVSKERGSLIKQKNKIVFVGHVISTKGVYELVNACKQIDGIELHIIGKVLDQVRNDLLTIAAEKGDGAWLKLHGEISHEEVLRAMMTANIFAFPSYTEGFPNVILEAMVCGCAIASSSVGAIPEMLDVNNKPCGICYKPQSIDDVRDSIIHLLSDGDLCENYSQQAMCRAYSEYSMQNVWQRLINIWS